MIKIYNNLFSSIIFSCIFLICSTSNSFGQDLTLNFNDQTGVLTAEALSNEGPYYFTWSQNYQILFEEETGRYSAIVIEEAGEYCIVVRNREGCEAQGCFIYCPNPVENIEIFHGSGTNTSDGKITLNLTGSDELYSYEWSPIESDEFGVGGLETGVYQVTITNNEFGCTRVEEITIKNCFGPPGTDISVVLVNEIPPTGHCTNDGAIDISVSGGVPPYTYYWTNNVNEFFSANTQDINNLYTAEYSVTVTDNACNQVKFVHKIYPREKFRLLYGYILNTVKECKREINLEVKGGTLPYFYQWDNGSTLPDITDLEPGSVHQVTITDNGGCREVVKINVGFPEELAIESIIQGTCQGSNNGSIDIAEVKNSTDPLTYNWSNGETTQTISNLEQGSYSVTVIDANDCEVIETFDVDSNVELQANVTQACPLSSRLGAVSLSPVGGTAPYSINWSTGQTSASLEDLEPGEYTVTVTDNNGCFKVETYNIQNLSSSISQWELEPSDEFVRDALFMITGEVMTNNVSVCSIFPSCDGVVSDQSIQSSSEQYSANGFDWFNNGCDAFGDQVLIRCPISDFLQTNGTVLTAIERMVNGPGGCVRETHCIIKGNNGLFYVSTVFTDCLTNPGDERENDYLSSTDTEKELELKVYPNPFKERFLLEISGSRINVGSKMQITNLTGKIIYTEEILIEKDKINKYEINFNQNIPTGVYHVQILGVGDNQRGIQKKIVHIN